MHKQMSPPPRANSRRRWRFMARPHAMMLGLVATLAVGALSATPALAAGGTVSGSFSVPTGATPANVKVYLVSKYGYRQVGAVVTPTGATTATYQFTGVDAGQYYVYFTDPTAADNVQSDYYGDGGADNIANAALQNVTDGGTVSLNTVGLTTGAIITGTVSDANKASEAAAQVYIYPVSAGNSPDPAFDGGNGVVTVSNGTYTITGLAPGTYVLDYYADGTGGTWRLTDTYVASAGLTYSRGDASQYAVAARSSTTVNFSVPALGTISGTVSSAAGPVGGAEVSAWDGFGDAPGYAVTAAGGTYSMVLLPGTYKVWFSGFNIPNLASTWYGGPTEAQASNITVAAGATVANINATLGAGGTITGTVVSAQGGTPLGGIEVDLVDAQGQYIDDSVTLPDGTYALTDVPAGTWYVRFDAGQAYSGSYYAQQFYGGMQTEFGAAAVQVSAGQTTSSINGALLPLGTAPIGLPTTSAAALSGLHNNKVTLRFKVAAGTGAGYLKTLTVGLPKGFSWNRGKLTADLSLGSGVTFTYAIVAGKLVITLSNGQPAVALSIKPGGISVSKAVQKAAGGLAPKPKKHHKHKHALAMAAAKKPTKAKDTIKSELIDLSVSDTTGTTTSLPITIKHPR